jgi:hypothetical protein
LYANIHPNKIAAQSAATDCPSKLSEIAQLADVSLPASIVDKCAVEVPMPRTRASFTYVVNDSAYTALKCSKAGGQEQKREINHEENLLKCVRDSIGRKQLWNCGCARQRGPAANAAV